MSDTALILKLCQVAKRELDSWRDSFTFYEIEGFIGSLLSQFRANKLITEWEEQVIRQRILGPGQ